MVTSLFQESVETAVGQSVQSGKILVVYNTDGSDEWLNKWFETDDQSLPTFQDTAVWLKLVKNTTQFDYFEQIFPSVIIPSMYLVFNGQIKSVIKGDNSTVNWNSLVDVLGLKNMIKKIETPVSISAATPVSMPAAEPASVPIPDSTNDNKKPTKENNGTPTGRSKNQTFKDEVLTTTQQIYHDEIIKERRAANQERDRIRKLLQADREERKAAKYQSIQNDLEPPKEVRDNIKDYSKLHTATCTLQIRLTNSETLIREFSSQDCLNDVRTWVDVNRTDGDQPYAFHRNIPRLTFSESHEMKSLEDLELTPRSVLILKLLESRTKKLNISEAQQPGNLIGQVYNGFSSWWGGSETTNKNDDVHNIDSNHLSPQTASRGYLSPRESQLRQEVNQTNMTSRSVSPNIFQLVNNDDLEDKEKSTYNGNNIKLDKKKKDDDYADDK